jgi:hypothetical protein
MKKKPSKFIEEKIAERKASLGKPRHLAEKDALHDAVTSAVKKETGHVRKHDVSKVGKEAEAGKGRAKADRIAPRRAGEAGSRRPTGPGHASSILNTHKVSGGSSHSVARLFEGRPK